MPTFLSACAHPSVIQQTVNLPPFCKINNTTGNWVLTIFSASCSPRPLSHVKIYHVSVCFCILHWHFKQRWREGVMLCVPSWSFSAKNSLMDSWKPEQRCYCGWLSFLSKSRAEERDLEKHFTWHHLNKINEKCKFFCLNRKYIQCHWYLIWPQMEKCKLVHKHFFYVLITNSRDSWTFRLSLHYLV